VSPLQKGANEEKQKKGVRHKEMLRLIKGEESEDAGLRRATQVRENLDCLREGDLGRVEGLRSAGVEDDEDRVAAGRGERGERSDKSGVGRIR